MSVLEVLESTTPVTLENLEVLSKNLNGSQRAYDEAQRNYTLTMDQLELEHYRRVRELEGQVIQGVPGAGLELRVENLEYQQTKHRLEARVRETSQEVDSLGQFMLLMAYIYKLQNGEQALNMSLGNFPSPRLSPSSYRATSSFELPSNLRAELSSLASPMEGLPRSPTFGFEMSDLELPSSPPSPGYLGSQSNYELPRSPVLSRSPVRNYMNTNLPSPGIGYGSSQTSSSTGFTLPM